MSHLKSWLSEHSDFTMKAVFVLLVCLPFLFANTVDESALKAYKRMTPQERLSGSLCLFCILWFVSSWIFYVLKLIFFKSRSILLTLEARKPLYYCLFVLFTKQTTKCNFNKFLIYMFTNNESNMFIYLFFDFDIHLFQCTRLTNLSKIGWLPMELLCLPEPAVLPVPLLQHWRQWESQPQYVPQLALCKFVLIVCWYPSFREYFTHII